VIYGFVSDSWYFNKAILTWVDFTAWVTAKNAILVIRPVSGVAVDNILYALCELDIGYGRRLNSRGYKVVYGGALFLG
ncbi:nicotinate phosphoribosyltransferase, partial [Francisella tularensis subsp. holarctica]|nr:nicotinate phosphoribosyltransferase [Francisella tularensis subsp. holarctica]